MTKRATLTRSGGIADFASAVYPSLFIFQFGQAVCLRHCAAYERMKHHETEFSHVLARKCPVCRGIGEVLRMWDVPDRSTLFRNQKF